MGDDFRNFFLMPIEVDIEFAGLVKDIAPTGKIRYQNPPVVTDAFWVNVLKRRRNFPQRSDMHSTFGGEGALTGKWQIVRVG